MSAAPLDDPGPLALPRLLLIADGFASGRGAGPLAQTPERVRKIAAEAVARGVRWVMLRDHAADDRTFARAAGRLTERVRDIRPDVRIAVNTRVDVARRLRADLHVGTRGPSVGDALETARVVGLSAHTPAEVREAEASGASYALFSPVYRTATHPEAEPVGLQVLRDAAAAPQEALPVLALGGLTPTRVAECLDAGAHGVAVLSGILDAHRPARAVDAFFTALARS
ncbi:MAG: thiamine phosphate synthase [Bacteroidota bacterium]